MAGKGTTRATKATKAPSKRQQERAAKRKEERAARKAGAPADKGVEAPLPSPPGTSAGYEHLPLVRSLQLFFRRPFSWSLK